MDLSGYALEKLREDSEFILYRGRRSAIDPHVLVLVAAAREVEGSAMRRLEHEQSLAGSLDPAWALHPLGTARIQGRMVLVLDDPGGRPMDTMLGAPLELKHFLQVAIGIASALRQMHACGLVHKDIKPANIFVDDAADVRLGGFGFATRLPRERQVAAPPEVIAGTLSYMAPEQTGRMNRSIDNRSDLYAFGVTLYEMLVGALPFSAADSMEWIYNHIACAPPPPSVRMEGIPTVVESLILKLLEKNAEDRYQTAGGVEHDLRRCLAGLNATRRVDDFPLAERDLSDRLLIPEKLYGRKAEVSKLLAAFDQVATQGKFDFLLISGDTGVGKSALVDELRRALYSTGGLFAGGKVDRYKRDIPYATLAEAFRGLLRNILSQDDAALDRWRTALLDALGVNGQLMVDLFPELALMLGEQPALASVSPPEARNRFNLVFRRFVGVFAQPEHPLVLFLDDLQWLDTATCDLLKLLSTDGGLAHLLVLCAYRSTEVDVLHGLGEPFASMANARSGKEIRLAPLELADVRQLTADALRMDSESVGPLAQLLLQKTQGNPFFTIQFLNTLNVEGLLVFDGATGAWKWDVDRIRGKGITDNVAELIATSLSRYEGRSLSIVKQFACLGGGTRTSTLAKLLGMSPAQVDVALREFVAAGLVHPTEHGYAFAHDGVQDAAYGLVPDAERAPTHLSIGRLLLEGIGEKELEDNIFEIVNQLNRGFDLIDLPAERMRLAELNLLAGKRAKAASAFDAALAYLDAGLSYLTRHSWDTDYRTTFELEFHRADCKFMTGDLAAAEERLAILAERCSGLGDLGQVVGRQLILHIFLGSLDRANELAVNCLRRMGVDLPLWPTVDDVEQEYRVFLAKLGPRAFESLLDLPVMQDQARRETMDVLEGLLLCASLVNADRHHLVCLRIVNISLDHGNTDETAHALACISGQVLGWRVGSFDDARRIAKISMSLCTDRGLDRYASRSYAVISGTVGPWTVPLSECYEIAVRATDLGREQGGVTYSAYGWSCRITALIDGGRALEEVHQQAESGLAFATKIKFSLVAEFSRVALAFVRALRGMTTHLASLNCIDFDERRSEEDYAAHPNLWHARIRYQVRKLQLNFYAGNHDACLKLIDALENEVGALRVFELVEYHFFSALARAAYLDSVREAAASPHFRTLLASRDQLARWAETCPANFSDRAQLVSAEIARLEGRELDAQNGYQEAIRLARDNGFVQNEGLAFELASRYYAARKFDIVRDAYLRSARSCYARWGAEGKVRQLDQAHPKLRDEMLAGSLGMLSASSRLQHLDLTAVLEMHQAVSREIVLDRLVEQLMIAVIEHGGAVRGLLLLPRDGQMRVVAEASAREHVVSVSLRRPSESDAQLAKSILNYVTRTHEVVMIDDALEANPYGADPYILKAKPRSVLCLPLVKQKRLVGVLYLENNLLAHTFTRDRLSILQLLASQAAISLENAELFLSIQNAQDQARRAGDELRRSFDMIPALAWRASADGTFEFANRQWHDYTGISEEDARTGSWMRGFHRDDVDKVSEKWRHLVSYRTSGEFEARMQRFDGEFRRYLVRVTPMRDERGYITMWHGTNTDIENLKRAEQAQEALARVSRVTAMGALTVSIAHEVNQPLMAIVTNAATCLQWLDDSQLNIHEARKAAQRIVRDGHRAGDVISSIRALARNSTPELELLSLADLVQEVLLLTSNEIERHAIAVETEFAADAGGVLGDRIQLQQVILNLVLNGIEAIDAARHQPRALSISTRLGDPGFVVVSIADTGVGIDHVGSEQIFEAFFTTKANGIGIGLSICRTIIEAHRGRLWATANAPHGTVLQFSLPMESRESMH